MIEIITKTLTKLSAILQTVQGWAVAAGIFVAEYFFADHATVVWLVLTATLLDAVWGIAVSTFSWKVRCKMFNWLTESSR